MKSLSDQVLPFDCKEVQNRPLEERTAIARSIMDTAASFISKSNGTSPANLTPDLKYALRVAVRLGFTEEPTGKRKIDLIIKAAVLGLAHQYNQQLNSAERGYRINTLTVYDTKGDYLCEYDLNISGGY